ncbi:NAD(P)/FAD-dependent oxidoreductase [Paractinoplanes rishiriensis]|uniref:NAD(P)/FAD-dependent oxidoreductase n=1 Tax=Paractinoplanes rishiriensis TaxID=1050105 RepID=UPI001944BCBF|nr:FAD-binding oxidoreductase [Actinoplanes rishiriensis]
MTVPSFWLHSLGPITPRPPLAGDRTADVAIVGGGYTGLWTAYYLARLAPALSVVVLEAEYCGFGASGRNGGWASGLFPVAEDKLSRRYGADRAAAMHAALADAVDEVGRVTAAEGIDCHYAKGGTISLVRSPAQLRRAYRTKGFVGAEEARAICGASDVLGGVYSPDCAALHPARLVRGLAEAVAARGVTIHEGTRVRRVARGLVETERGTVRAGTVVRALEGYTARLAGHRRTLAPVYSLMIATEPLPAADWERIGLRRRETFTDERHMIIYGQRTADDRLAFGGRGAPYHFGSRVEPDFDRVPAVFDSLQATLTEMFGIRPPIAHRWGGPLGIPRDWMPSVGLEDGIGWAGGYVGDGVAAANLAGRTLADLISGTESDRTALPWVGHRSRLWEPEPIRWLGINAALRATHLRDALERS